jgi:hypothetical protein
MSKLNIYRKKITNISIYLLYLNQILILRIKKSQITSVSSGRGSVVEVVAVLYAT